MHSGLEFKSMYIHHIPNNNISYEILTQGGNVINFFSNKNLSSKYPHYNIFRIVPQWKKYTNFTIDGIERKKKRNKLCCAYGIISSWDDGPNLFLGSTFPQEKQGMFVSHISSTPFNLVKKRLGWTKQQGKVNGNLQISNFV